MAKIEEAVWTTEDSENLYRVKLWGDNYFAVNDEGNLSVRPILGDPISIDIYKVVQDLKSQRIEFPLLIRFQDLLRSRVTELYLSLIHISEPTRLLSISYAVFCLK